MSKKPYFAIIILYLAFVSMGLPDNMLGIAWPEMRKTFLQPIDAAGILLFVSMICAAIAGYFSGYLVLRYKEINVVVFSTALIVIGSLGYAFAPTWFFIIAFTIPLGFGGGAIDGALNSYVASHYSSKQMNWLHGFWGVGTTLGAFIMTGAYALNLNWSVGFFVAGALQFLMLCLFWFSRKEFDEKTNSEIENGNFKYKPSLDTFFSASFFFIYTFLEANIGIWGYSYLFEYIGVSDVWAGSYVSVYWAMLTLGRFVIGFFSKKVGESKIITYGLVVTLLSVMLIYFNVYYIAFPLAGFALAGIYPSMMSLSSKRFCLETSKVLIGHQAGAAALGVAIAVPLAGRIFAVYGLQLFMPLLCLAILILFFIDLRLKKLSL